MELSRIITESTDLQNIINHINNGGSSMYSASELVGQYVATAIMDNDGPAYDDPTDEIEAWFDILEDAGARFVYESAMVEATKWLNFLREES